MKIKLLAVSAIALQLCACSTVMNGTNQAIAFTTGQEEGADCSLTGGKNGAVNETFQTPSEIRVKRSSKALNLKCSKAGFQTAEKLLDGKVEGTSAGNVVLGGFIGAGVDAATGALYRYPETVDLPLLRIGEVAAPVEPIAK